MSSTLSRPKTATATADTVAIPEQVTQESDETEFGGFVHAIVIGVLIGVPVVGLVIATIVKLAAPDMSTAGILAITIWVAVWIGVFLGGTVTVGLWSKRQHEGH